jgi:uncharacterized protein (DUF1800 family)
LRGSTLDTRGARPTGISWLDSRGHNSITAEQRYFWPQFGDWMIWNQLLDGPDEMRKRIALALSEVLRRVAEPDRRLLSPVCHRRVLDLLTANAFGNFRTLLEKITLNAGMGFFLNTKGNLKEDANGRQPDENYAREVMQLFTIGLYELNPDGTHKLDANNQPIETYGQSDITNLARVFTGYGLGLLSRTADFSRRRLGRLRRCPARTSPPTDVVQPDSHSNSRSTSSAPTSRPTRRAARRCASRSTGCSTMRTPVRSSRAR